MKKIVLMALAAVGIVGSASAQHDDLYFVPKKKKVTVEQVEEKPLAGDEQAGASSASHVTTTSVKLMEMDGVKLVFEDDTLEYIVDTAVEYKLGARGLRSIVETIMMDKMFEIPSSGADSCVITKEYARQQIEKSNVMAVPEQ